MKKRILTGIKPTGSPHLGNYYGAIKPALNTEKTNETFYFIADYHALTTIKNPQELQTLTQQVAAAWIACGLDPQKSILYKQSDIPEIFELAWILSCFTPKGLLNRAHAYKAAVDQNTQTKKDPDKNIHQGLYSYPVLMAADILLFNATHVPVGADQKQHVEIARDIAQTFNKTYKTNTLLLPEPLIDTKIATIPGTDGQKMSKSYQNTIPLFDSEKAIKKAIMKIQTDSLPIEAKKNPDTCNLYKLCSLIMSPQDLNTLQTQYKAGGLGYGTVKTQLLETFLTTFAPIRATYTQLIQNPTELNSHLTQGAKKAKKIAQENLHSIKQTIGIL